MQVQTLTLPIGNIPGFVTNCYIIAADEDSRACVVIDPASRCDRIESALRGRVVEAIVMTHRHGDHIGALAQLAKNTGAPVYAHALDVEGLEDEKANGALALGLNIEIPAQITSVVDADIISIEGLNLTVLHTPGHTIGSICLYEEAQGVLFSGDTLFRDTYGRTDLPTGNPRQMRESLSKLALLPANTVVYPGHDQPTTIGRECNRR